MKPDDQVALVRMIVRSRHIQTVLVSLLIVVVVAVVAFIAVDDAYARADAVRERHGIACEIIANRDQVNAIAEQVGLVPLSQPPVPPYCTPKAPQAGRR